MGQLGCIGDLLFVEDDGDLDLRCGDHLDVDAPLGKGFEELGRHARVGAHSDTDDAELGDPILLADLACPDLGGNAVDEIADLLKFVAVHREGNIGRTRSRDILDDDVDHDMGIS